MRKGIVKTPNIGSYLLKHLIISRNYDFAIGDFIEIYHTMARARGILIAKMWFWFQVLSSIPKFLKNSIYWSFVMLKNYLKISFRNMKRQKMYSSINLSGLAIGMACCILILFWVQDELSYDRFHKNADNIYRVMSEGGKYNWKGVRGTPMPLATASVEGLPEVVNAVRFASHSRLVFKYKDKAFYEEGGIIADQSIFEVFTFPFVKGDPKSAFTDPFHLVITKSMASKYFGDEDPIGKTMEVEGNLATIMGVIRDVPENSHIKFDFLSSFKFVRDLAGYSTHWGAFNFVTYVQLQEGISPEEMAEKMTVLARDQQCPQVMEGVHFRLQPLLDVHLTSSPYSRNWESLGDIRFVYAFSVIAFFILFIACINFVNLSTARSVNRAREVGLRKVVGSNRSQLIKQFFGESIFYVIISFMISIVLVVLLLPTVNNITGKNLSFNYLNFSIILSLFGIIVLTGLIAGSYPAVYLSGFNPVRVFKGISVSGSGKSLFRRILVVTQFSLSLILIIGAVILFRQLDFIRNKNLGFDTENIVFVPIKENIVKQYNAFKSELLQDPNIIGVTSQNYNFSGMTWRNTGWNWEGKDPNHEQDLVMSYVDYNYFEFFNMEIVNGRGFSEEFSEDADNSYILNEEAIRQMKLESPVGKWFQPYRREKGNIVGIVKNAHLRSLHSEIEQRVFMVLNDYTGVEGYGMVLIKIKADEENSRRTVNAALKKIESTWNKFNSKSPFEFRFFDEHYENLYRLDKKVGLIINYFTVLTVFVACLGLFGLAAFMTERRTKEIGIRKVLGASVSGLVGLLSKEFLILIAVSNILAWPVGLYVMNKVLQNYAYRINISVFDFIFAAFFALLIAFLTVAYQAIKSANNNPVNALRYE